MKLYLFLILVFIVSCRNAKPVDNITAPDTLYVKTDVSNSIPENQDNPLHTIKDVSISDIPYQKPTLLARIFKRDSPKKVKLKNVTIVHQTAAAGATIGAVTTDAPKKTIAKDKVDEKLKGQNAIKGDNNKAEASKSDKSLLMAVGIGIAVMVGYFYFRKKKVV